MAMSLSIGLGLNAIIAAGAGGVALAQRGASTLNRISPLWYSSGDATATDNIYRVRFILGSCDWSDLQVSVYNWVFGQWGVEFSSGANFEIAQMAIEIGSEYHAVTWGGSASVTVVNGQTDVQSDKVFPADLGIAGSTFSRGTEGYIRFMIRGGSSAKWPMSYATQFASSRLRFVPGSVTVANGVYGTGDFDISSGDYSQAPLTVAPVLLGTPVSAGKFAGGIGDSITENVGDDSATAATGSGFTRVAYSNYTTKANPLAVINFGWSGGTILNWIGDGTNTPSNSSATAARIELPEAYLKYCNIMFEQYGTNATLQSHTSKLWTVIRRGSTGCKLVRSSLFPRSSSTDSWATLGNQTAAHAPGGDVDLFEQYCESQVGAGVDYYINYDSLRADVNRANANYFKWLTNGTPNWLTPDGIHPSSTAYELIYGGEARALIDTITP